MLAIFGTKYEKKKLETIDSFISLIFYIKGQIDCFSMPISKIMENAVSSGITDRQTFGELINENRIYLDRESESLLYRFISELGGTYKEEQIKRCDYYASLLSEKRSKEAYELPMKTRLCSALWLCASFGVAIILW